MIYKVNSNKIIDKVNSNGRVYPKKFFNREVEKYMESVKNDKIQCEINHIPKNDINYLCVSDDVIYQHKSFGLYKDFTEFYNDNSFKWKKRKYRIYNLENYSL